MRKRYENYKHNSCNKELSSVGQTLCENDTIFKAYSLGVKELSQYLLNSNQALLHTIFLNYAEQIVAFGIT